MSMHRCPGCGHHHGTRTENGTFWPSCGAYTETDTGGIQRCCCTGPNRHHGGGR